MQLNALASVFLFTTHCNFTYFHNWKYYVKRTKYGPIVYFVSPYISFEWIANRFVCLLLYYDAVSQMNWFFEEKKNNSILSWPIELKDWSVGTIYIDADHSTSDNTHIAENE